MSTLKTNTLSNVAGTASTAIENAINGSAKAWVNFNGTGTVAINGSFNVSSITDNGVGQYTVNFTTALSNANYASAAHSAQTLAGINGTQSGTKTTTSFGVVCSGISGGTVVFTDPSEVNVAVFR
jgi:hypothetical protein